ncbi:MAG: glycine reductase, partial [Chloroflexota bacterium]|nr:glycine reductase [Chloroflexota bacterium]
MSFPVIAATSYVLCHTPQLVRYGSKPAREIGKAGGDDVAARLDAALRPFEDAVGYPPNQVFIGNTAPGCLRGMERPWWKHPIAAASRFSEWGEIMPELEFLGLLKAADQFNVVQLRADVAEASSAALGEHPLPLDLERERITGVSPDECQRFATAPGSLPLFLAGDPEPVGCILIGHDEDTNLVAHILLENLATKASGALAVRHLI